MVKKGLIFCDIDGTLCFHAEAHGMQRLGTNPDGTVEVRAPDARTYAAHDLSIADYGAYMSVETHQLCERLRSFFDIVLVTGGRMRTLQSRRRFLDFADAFILENGGAILDGDLRVHPVWSARMEPDRRVLATFSRLLTADGWILDTAGRETGIRIRRRDNPHRPADEFAALLHPPQLPESLRVTMNLGHIDIIPLNAGKHNAVRFLMEERGCSRHETIGIGDDVNDIEYLREVGRAYLLASSYPEAVREAEREGWTVSEHSHFEGIHEILSGLLSLFRDQRSDGIGDSSRARSS
jgi:hydroxymethylpyrimidine pyrophosphatase-like HAD family hydrolase